MTLSNDELYKFLASISHIIEQIYLNQKRIEEKIDLMAVPIKEKETDNTKTCLCEYCEEYVLEKKILGFICKKCFNEM